MPDFDPKVDVRPTIAHGKQYDPSPTYSERPYIEYPKWVHVGEGKDRKSLIANNRTEEDAILGVKQAAPKPVSVDIAALGQSEPVPVQKRKYTKRAAPTPLPQNLE